MPLRVFWSYSHKDSKHLAQIRDAFAVMIRTRQIESWHDGEIAPGAAWAEEIRGAMAAADVLLLLVSNHFLASCFCIERELKEALARRAAGVRVVPIILSSCDWQSDPLLEGLQALPDGGEPLRGKRSLDLDRLQEVVKGVRRLALQASAAAPPTPGATRPPLPEGLPFICNRRPQESQLSREVGEHFRRRPRRPFVSLVHGPESEHLLGYLTRLRAFSLPMYLDLPRDTELQHIFWLRWPDPGVSEERAVEQLREGLADSLHCAPDRISEALKAHGRPVLVYSRLSSGDLVRGGEALLRAYLRFWDSLPPLPPPAKVVACALVHYEPPEEDAARAVQELLAGAPELARRFANLTMSVLPRLESVPREDVEGLAGKAIVQRYCPLERHLSEWHADVAAIYGTRDRLPMKELEPHLRDLLPKYAARR